MTRHYTATHRWDKVFFAVMALVILAAFSIVGWAIYDEATEKDTDPPLTEQLRRVTFEGQECVVIEHWNGNLRGIDCDWSAR